MKRAVFLIRNIAPKSYGGGERYQIELGKVLKANHYEPIIFTASEKLIEEAKNNQIKFVRAPYLKMQNWSSWRNILLPMYGLWQLKLQSWYKKQIKKYDPVVLNVQSRDELIGATLAGLKCKKRIIWTDHADFRTWSLINVDKRLKNQIGKWILRCAKKVYKIVMVNNHEKQALESLIKPLRLNNLVVIENGVVDESRNFDGIKILKKSFCFIGRVVKDKGVMELVNAFKIVAEEHPDAILNIYGDGNDIEECKRLARGSNKINFLGYTKEPLRVMAQNEIFVLPSYHEGLSLALLEAAMMGKKIIATNIDGNREVVKDGITGFLVPIKNVEKLVDAMVMVLEDDKTTTTMSKNVREYYQENFDLEKIFKEKMAKIYEAGKNE
ncbi:glycosyltransferase [Candidatus Saccharibacteria bacterium]|nr:glycosyltransferase [Candidatus Saccharibacteria bacterium]